MSFQDLLKECPVTEGESRIKILGDEKCECSSCSEVFYKDDMYSDEKYEGFYCKICWDYEAFKFSDLEMSELRQWAARGY